MQIKCVRRMHSNNNMHRDIVSINHIHTYLYEVILLHQNRLHYEFVYSDQNYRISHNV